MSAEQSNVSEEELMATYAELAGLDNEFDACEHDVLTYQCKALRPLYEKRQAVIAKIPNFWTYVLDQAPSDLDEYITAEDHKVLATSLKSINVRNFEVENGAVGPEGFGDPRSVTITLEFEENEWFTDKTLEKTFWYRHDTDGWAGLISEPVRIHWKEGKDLTKGFLDEACNIFPLQKNKPKGEATHPDVVAFREKLVEHGSGAMSFFSFFGFHGSFVTEEDNKAAVLKRREHLKLRREGKPIPEEVIEVDETAEENDALNASTDIFPGGEDLAFALAEDLWPGAIGYFNAAHEEHEHDDELDSDEEDEDDEMEE